MLFPCNRRLEEAVRACPRRPENILELGKAFLNDITVAACEAFVKSFLTQSALPLTEDVSEKLFTVRALLRRLVAQRKRALPQRVVT